MSNEKTPSDTALNLKDTLNLPYTQFPMKASLAQREPEMLARWQKLDIYQLLRSAVPCCNTSVEVVHPAPEPACLESLWRDADPLALVIFA